MTTQTQILADEANPAVASDFLRGLIEANELARALGINRDTLARMTKDANLAFPQPFSLGRATYYSISSVKLWVASQAGLDWDE